MKLLERFEANVMRIPNFDCWIWIGDRRMDGYGRIYFDGKRHYAHRVSYELHIGPIPKGLLVCHHCDNPTCVNPEHLFIGTDLDNMRDMMAKGRWPDRACRNNGNVKLTELDVAAIREAEGTQHEIAKRFKISRSQVARIRRGESWNKFVIAID